MNLYSIYDSKAEVHCPPFVAHNVAVAIRMFRDLLNQPDSQISRAPADFTLFELGTFDESNGSLSLLEAKKSIANALELVHHKQDEPSDFAKMSFKELQKAVDERQVEAFPVKGGE